MAIQTVTNIDNLLKNVYQGPVRDQLNSETRLLNMWKKKEVKSWEGRKVLQPLRSGRNEGVMATAEDSALPVAGRQASLQFDIPIRYLHGRISITAQSIKHSKSDRSSFVRALEFELNNLVSDLADDRNRILCGYGSGILCLLNGDPGTGTTLVADAPGGVTGATNGTRFLQPNQMIAIVAPGTQTIREIHTISSVDSHTNATVAEAFTAPVLDNDEVIRGSNASGNASAADIEPDGILAAVDDGTYVGTYHGLSRTTNTILKSTVIASVGAFSTDALYRALYQADQVGNGEISRFVCGGDTLLEYVKLTEADRRYVAQGNGPISPDAGVRAAGIDWNKAVTFAGVPVQFDKDFAFGTLVGVDERYLERYVLVEGEWVDEDGAVLFRDANKDNFEARYRVWENFHTPKPNAHVRLDGITTTVPTFHVL